MNITDTTPAIDLFHRIYDEMNVPANIIAARMGLHVNTVERWASTKCVPEHYNSDFRRMLGYKGIPTDQFFTYTKVAQQCYEDFLDVMDELNIDVSRYRYIEPSAGSGSFYGILHEFNPIGMDLQPYGIYKDEIIREDFLLWEPKETGPYIVIGNPPFGLRGHLALQFINHAAKFADVVAFILPQLFESDGKGVPAKRVCPDLKLAYSKTLDPNSFVDVYLNKLKIPTIFQVWTKINHKNIRKKPIKNTKGFIKIYSLSDGGTPATTRNKRMIGKCDVYIPSTCYQGMKAYLHFDQLPNQRGYGIVLRNSPNSIKRVLFNHDWNKTAFRSTNSALNLRKSLIEKVVADAGFYNIEE